MYKGDIVQTTMKSLENGGRIGIWVVSEGEQCIEIGKLEINVEVGEETTVTQEVPHGKEEKERWNEFHSGGGAKKETLNSLQRGKEEEQKEKDMEKEARKGAVVVLRTEWKDPS